MKFLKIMIVVLLLIMTMGAVCSAEDTTYDSMNDDSQILKTVHEDIITDKSSDTLKTTQYDVSSTSGASFTNLADEIEEKDILDLTHDYKFNNTTDNNNGILINKDNFVLNANGYTIDGNNQSRIFNITGNNVTLKNLILTGGNSNNSGAIISVGTLTLDNVTFINNYATKMGGAVGLKNTILNINNSRFIDNYANAGSSICLSNGTLNLHNTNITSNVYSKRGQIVLDSCECYIDNAVFSNIFSEYTPAIFFETSKTLSVINSKFINLTANITAGAIGVKDGGKIYINDCEFINITSSKNAGAIIADISGSNGNNGTVTLINTTFKDTFSEFGGAYMQYGGKLWMNNSQFINNHATFNGGSIYLSYTDSEINNCNFTSNGVDIIEDYPTYGGAIYSDNSTLNIDNSKFINNTASAGNAIYTYDTSYIIKNSVFENNENAIYTVFDKNSTIDENNTFNEDTVLTNETDYATIICGEGLQLTLLDNRTINISSIPTSFDLREYGWVSSVKNQGWMGSCWAFGMTGALESALLKATGIDADFSENNMQNTMLQYSKYGIKGTTESGANIMSIGYLLSWLGAFTQDADVYDELGKISPLITTNEDVHIQDMMFIPHTEIPDDTRLKLAIMKYGSIDVTYNGQSTYNNVTPYYNPTTYAQYINDSSVIPNHGVSIVGWDDNFSASNFGITPPGDGAWIVKNSWGTDWGDNGYLYVSYYDKTLLKSTKVLFYATSIIIENTEVYNKNYQYETFWGGDIDSRDVNISYYNVFDALDDDLIAAVGTYFNESDMPYTIEIYVNDELKLTQEEVSPYIGYHTIKLNKYIPIKEGDIFIAKITSKEMPYTLFNDSKIHYTENISFVSYDGEKWEDCYNLSRIACLKVYTLSDNTKIINNKDVTVDYSNESYFTVQVVTDDGHRIGAGAVINFTINGKTTTTNTDNDGIAKIKITELPGNYEVTTTYNNQSYKNNVTVNLVDTTLTLDPISDYVDTMTNLTAIVNSTNPELKINEGSVVFYISDKELAVAEVVYGKASISIHLTEDMIKYDTVEAAYSGTKVFNNSTGRADFNVIPKVETVTVLDPVKGYVGQTVKLHAIVDSLNPGLKINEGRVIFMTSNHELAVADVINGEALATIILSKDLISYKEIVAVYIGERVYNDSASDIEEFIVLSKDNPKPLDKLIPQHIKKTVNQVPKTVTTSNTYKIYINNNLIYSGNDITLCALNEIFDLNFTNGHLLIYLDGKLVFNGTSTDDLSQIIIHTIESLLGEHEIKVVFTDSEGNNNTYKENIIIK